MSWGGTAELGFDGVTPAATAGPGYHLADAQALI